jgi:hypothetical protein
MIKQSAGYPNAPTMPPCDLVPTAAFYHISPQTAKKWLEYNSCNRGVRKGNVVDLSADVNNGEFDLNGETIKISRPLGEGEIDGIPAGKVMLIDGQHRLRGAANSEKGIDTLVVSGLKFSVQDTVDLTAHRKPGDMLKMHQYANASTLGAAAKLLWYWEQGDKTFTSKRRLTRRALLSFVKDHPTLERSVEIALLVYGENKNTRPSGTALAHYLMSQIAPNETAWFFAKLGDGSEMMRNHPIMSLRRRLERDRIDKYFAPASQYLGYHVRAWNALAEDRPLERIQHGPKEDVPELVIPEGPRESRS